MLAIDVRVAAQSLGRLVDQVRDSGESVMISTPGGAKAILMPVDEFDPLQEILHALIQPNLREELAQADRDYAAGQTISEDELRVQYGLPDRQRNGQSWCRGALAISIRRGRRGYFRYHMIHQMNMTTFPAT